MNTRVKILESSGLLIASRIAIQVMAFGRNVFIARILTPEDYGLAATFWIATGLVAAITEFGFEQRLIQMSDGDDERVGAVAQTLYFIRGMLIACILLLISGTIARLFNATEATWAFQLLAVLPLVGGLKHRDLDRSKRQLNFKPEVLTEFVSEFVITIIALPVAFATRDYSCFLYLAIIKAALVVGLSHLIAERGFRLGWNRTIVANFLIFGWPLLVNSIMIYATSQGDRMILAMAYTKEELGAYSIAISLIMMIQSVPLTVTNQMAFPILARSKDLIHDFISSFERYVFLVAQLAIFLVIGGWILGPMLISIVFGEAYAVGGTVVGLVATAQAIRLVRGTPSMAAMSLGNTTNLMIANFWRQAGLLLMVVVAINHLSVQWIAASAIVGELCAGLCAALMLRRHVRLTVTYYFRAIILVLATSLVAALMAHFLELYSNQIVIPILALALFTACEWILIRTLPASGRWFLDEIFKMVQILQQRIIHTMQIWVKG